MHEKSATFPSVSEGNLLLSMERGSSSFEIKSKKERKKKVRDSPLKKEAFSLSRETNLT